MQHFTPEGDQISMRGEGLVGLPVPADLEHLDNGRLIFDGVNLLDASTITDWLIDDDGRKRHPDVHGDKDWQVIACSFDDALVIDNGVWRVETDADQTAAALEVQTNQIKLEAARRINLIAPNWKQNNMLARSIEILEAGTDASADDLTDKAALQAVWGQIKTIRDASDTIEAMSPIPTDWRDDIHWQ